MRCAEILTKSSITIGEQESVGDAAAKLISSQLTNLPIVDSRGHYIAMFGLYDLLSLLAPRVALAGDLMSNLRFIEDDSEELRRNYRDVENRRAAEVADRNAPTLAPNSSAVEALRLFCRRCNSVPVVDPNSGCLVGIVSGWDAIRCIVGAGQLGDI